MTTAFVLGAGGVRGDFQVGALQFLYHRGILPDIVCGTSIGAVNGLIVIGGGPEKLAATWLSFKKNDDMYTEEPWLASLEPETKKFFRLNDVEPGPQNANRTPGDSFYFPMLIFNAFNYWISTVNLIDALGKYQKARSFYNLSPIAAKLRSQLNIESIQRSNIRLRIAVVSLESGELEYITETGAFSGKATGKSVDLIDAAIASCSIPAIFSPVKLDSENYVDGGMREMLPVQAAVDLGATQVYAIVCSKSGVTPIKSFDNSNLVDIGLRATRDIMPDEIQRKETDPHCGRGANMKLIQPDLDIHDILTIDPGLISISMAYGYMRAFDIIEGSTDPGQLENFKRTSDEITGLRLKIWNVEHVANGRLKPGERFSISGADSLRSVRKMKKDLKALVDERQGLGGSIAIPDDFELWYKNWERHKWVPLVPTPWDSFSSPSGTVNKETPP